MDLETQEGLALRIAAHIQMCAEAVIRLRETPLEYLSSEERERLVCRVAADAIISEVVEYITDSNRSRLLHAEGADLN